MSSFLGRAAQYYAMHPRVLLSTLMDGSKWTGAGRPDVDLRPPEVLQDRLASAVRGWRSPLEGWSGFVSWVLAPSERRAYCPACFQEDLAIGRTPYFRLDWAPVLVTACWTHNTPLFSWEAVDSTGARTLPKEWIYRLDNCGSVVPEFMRRHLEALKTLSSARDSAEDARSALKVIRGVQALVEKSSDTAMNGIGYRRSPMDCFRWDFSVVVEQSARFRAGSRSAPLADIARPRNWSEWFGPIPLTARRRTEAFAAFGLRQTGCVRWRRTLKFFAIQVLRAASRPAVLPELCDVWSAPFPELEPGFAEGLEPDQLETWQRIQSVLGRVTK